MYHRKLGIPRTINKWIANKKMCTKGPTANSFKHDLSFKYLLCQDDIECILNVVLKKMSI